MTYNKDHDMKTIYINEAYNLNLTIFCILFDNMLCAEYDCTFKIINM